MNEKIDLGSGHAISIAVWDPDLDLNPQYVHLADQLPARVSGIVTHGLPDGSECSGIITFDTWIAQEYFKGPYWTVHSWDPLTLSPSLLCHCGDHGFIREGRWIPA